MSFTSNKQWQVEYCLLIPHIPHSATSRNKKVTCFLFICKPLENYKQPVRDKYLIPLWNYYIEIHWILDTDVLYTYEIKNP